MADSERKRLKFIGCEIIYREACYLAATGPNRVDLEFLRKGLHDLDTGDMAATVQAAIDAVDEQSGYEAILLGYARCSDGVVGLTARQVPLVIPRAHDCITFFFGSRAAYREYFDASPGTYYMTTGWAERNQAAANGSHTQPAYGKTGVMGKLGLTESYEQMVAKYGKENADYIVASTGSWEQNYSRCLYLKMDICDEEPFMELARQRARRSGWEFQIRDGSFALLRKLFTGQWDQDFLVVHPGRRIVARNDELILDASD